MKALLAFALLAVVGAPALAADNLKAFPAAAAGTTRYVINLPKLDDEDDAQVEIQVGKIVSTDARNRYSFGGKIERETIKGWGYDRYTVRALGPMSGTQMAVDPSVSKVERFVTLRGGPNLIRYNSKLPVVVYVPDGVEVRYRVWRPASTAARAVAG